MYRNKDFFRLCIITILFLIAEAWVAIGAGENYRVIGFAVAAFYAAIVILSTIGRYREIKKLSDYLVRIQNDIRINENNIYELNKYDEGELSILHDEIFKVTKMLMTQAELLSKDKIFLANTLADISHQLKTPLTSMMICTDLLEEENLSLEKRREFTRNIDNQLKRIEWLVSTLLKMSKLDAGTLKISSKEVDVRSMLEASVEHLLIPIELKGQTLEIAPIDGCEEVKADLDFNWTLEAMANIVKNCVEHTGEGGTIRILYGNTPLYTQIIIEDNGEGIDGEDINNIFTRFYKGKNSSKESVGIGLAFSRQIIELEGGKIDVSSQIGKGTRFLIKFYRDII